MRVKIVVSVTALAIVTASMLVVSPADAQWRYRHYHHHGGGGAIAGFAAGAILGGVLAAQRPYGYYQPGYGDDAVRYCLSRFRSYDPASGTYLGYDGLRHPCP